MFMSGLPSISASHKGFGVGTSTAWPVVAVVVVLTVVASVCSIIIWFGGVNCGFCTHFTSTCKLLRGTNEWTIPTAAAVVVAAMAAAALPAAVVTVVAAEATLAPSSLLVWVVGLLV